MSTIEIEGSTVLVKDIASLRWDPRHYANCTINTLVVTMRNGHEYRIESGPWNNVYALHDLIKRAMNEDTA